MQTGTSITAVLGTDLKFQVRLVSQDEERTINIQSVDAYFVNKDLREEVKQVKKCFKFLRRYPIEPCVNDLKSTICCLNNPGIYGYNARPVGVCAPVYAGFGVEPFGKPHHVFFKKHEMIKAPVYYTGDRSVVEIYFPAALLDAAGNYDLVVNATLYDNDYRYGHCRIVTTIYSDAAILRDITEQLPTDATQIGIDMEVVADVHASSDKYVQSGEVKPVNGDTHIVLDLAGADGTDDVAIDISNIADWYEG